MTKKKTKRKGFDSKKRVIDVSSEAGDSIVVPRSERSSSDVVGEQFMQLSPSTVSDSWIRARYALFFVMCIALIDIMLLIILFSMCVGTHNTHTHTHAVGSVPRGKGRMIAAC